MFLPLHHLKLNTKCRYILLFLLILQSEKQKGQAASSFFQTVTATKIKIKKFGLVFSQKLMQWKKQKCLNILKPENYFQKYSNLFLPNFKLSKHLIFQTNLFSSKTTWNAVIRGLNTLLLHTPCHSPLYNIHEDPAHLSICWSYITYALYRTTIAKNNLLTTENVTEWK